MTKPSAGLVSAMKRAPREVPQDKLDRLRESARLDRDLRLKKEEVEETLRDLNKKLLLLEHKELPELFSDCGMTVVGLEAEGNLPAYEMRVHPYYHANIAADWDQERKDAAYGWLNDNGHGDILKTNVTLSFSKSERERADEVCQLLEEHGFKFSVEYGVPWTTLTAFVREQVERVKRDPSAKLPPLDTLGAVVGRVVKLKPVGTD